MSGSEARARDGSLRFVTRSLVRRLLLALAFLSVDVCSVAAEDFLPGVKRIVFLGDSITYSGQYVDVFEAMLFTQYPQRRFEVIDCGLPSETVSGLSEEGHAGGKFPRPDLHERLARVLAATKPDLVFACYGMNDGIYLPLSVERFQKFKDGIAKLRAHVAAAGAQIIHLTPPVFDPLPIRARVAPAEEASGNRPFERYDEVLGHYAAWLLGQRTAGWRVIDVHGAMTRALETARRRDATFTFAKDGVHPDAAGHEVIAFALIDDLTPKAAGFRQLYLESAWAASPAKSTLLGLVRKRGRILADAWLTETGHQRPGMAKGLPLAEATARAAALERELRALPQP